MAKPFSALRDPKLDFNDYIPFGRYRGYTIKEILKDRPEYIAWLIDNTSYTFTQRVVDVVDIYCPYSDDVDDRHYDNDLILLYDDIPF